MTEDTNDAVAIEHETLTRLANLIVTVVPLALLGFAGQDLVEVCSLSKSSLSGM